MNPDAAASPPVPRGRDHGHVPYRRRGGRVAKLPPMNASERGKYYRQKYKAHELDLERAIERLRRQVQQLELFHRVRDELARRDPFSASDAIVVTLFEYFARVRRNGVSYESSFATFADSGAVSSHAPAPISPPAFSAMQASMTGLWRERDTASTRGPSSTGADHADTRLVFELRSLRVEGGVDAPVILLHGVVRITYTRATIDHIFPHLVHYGELLAVLLDKEIAYPCTYHFFFGSGGTCEHKIVEADYVLGLQHAVESVEDVQWLLDGSHRYRQRRDSLEDVMRGPGT